MRNLLTNGIIFSSFLLSLLTGGSVRAGDVFSQQAEDLFQSGIRNYREGDYVRARLDFQDILARLPLNQRSSAAQLMLGKTLYKLGEYEKAIQAAEDLLDRYPQSRYAPYATYLIGSCHYREGRYDEALLAYNRVLDMEADEGLMRRAEEVIDALVSLKLSEAEVEELRRKGLLRGYTEPDHEARQVMEGLLRGSVGLIAPLSGDDRTFGEELRDGVLLALSGGLSLVIEDSGSDPIGAIKAAQRLSEDDRILAIIGPVFSPSTIAAAAVADCRGVPLIAPTANEDGIASIGDHIFQMNITPRVQGELIAEYAIKELELETFASLTPLDSRGEGMAEGFASAVRQLGGELLIQEWYQPGATDFGEQLKRIREAGLSLLPPDSLSSVIAYQETTETLAPVSTIDGVLVAGAPDDIALIAPQLVFYMIRTQLLGGSGWNSQDVIRMGGKYVEGTIFVSDYFERSDFPAFRNFVDQFRIRFNKDPTKVAAYGYDAAYLVADAYKNGATTREKLLEALVEINGYKGASGEISFSHRANRSAYLLKIHRGRIIEIGSISKGR